MVRDKAEDAGGLTPAKDDDATRAILAAELDRFSSVSTIQYLLFPVLSNVRQRPAGAGRCF